MAAAAHREGEAERAAIDAVEAAILAPRVGEEFTAAVVDADRRGARVLLRDPAVIVRFADPRSADGRPGRRLVSPTSGEGGSRRKERHVHQPAAGPDLRGDRHSQAILVGLPHHRDPVAHLQPHRLPLRREERQGHRLPGRRDLHRRRRRRVRHHALRRTGWKWLHGILGVAFVVVGVRPSRGPWTPSSGCPRWWPSS